MLKFTPRLASLSEVVGSHIHGEIVSARWWIPIGRIHHKPSAFPCHNLASDQQDSMLDVPLSSFQRQTQSPIEFAACFAGVLSICNVSAPKVQNENVRCNLEL